MITSRPDRSVVDTLETTRDKFIGKPLKSLYKNHAFSKKSFVLFCEDADGSNKRRLGEDPNLSLIILRNPKYADHIVASVYRYYDQIHVVVNPPKKEGK